MCFTVTKWQSNTKKSGNANPEMVSRASANATAKPLCPDLGLGQIKSPGNARAFFV
jgi:hypothetical protein